MSQINNAFKMPYREKDSQEFISFDKNRKQDEVHTKNEMYEKLLRCDDRDSVATAVLGYD